MKKGLHFIATVTVMLLLGSVANAQRIAVTLAGTGVDGNTEGIARQSWLHANFFITVDGEHNVYFSDQSNTVIKKLWARTGKVTTFAGGGSSSADGVPAISASLSFNGIVSDPAGNIYIAQSTRVRRVDAGTGLISTVAGTGTVGFSGDGGSALTASFALIKDIAIDVAGNLYLLDAGNARIRMIDAFSGNVYTIAGSGVTGYTGDGGPATAATMSGAKYLGVDPSGNVYFVDQSSSRIRRIDAATGIITTVVGGGSTLYHCSGGHCMTGPTSGMCVGHDGDVIFNESSCSCREWRPALDTVLPVGGNYYVESFRDDTDALQSLMAYQYGICVDDHNDLYIADQGNRRIRKLIQVSSTPQFAFGEAQSINPCMGYTSHIDSMLWVTDLDSAQTETWTLISSPTMGTVTGFPATAMSNGLHTTVKPTGLSYTPSASFVGTDSFRVRVSDGMNADTITIYSELGSPTPATLSGPTETCYGDGVTLHASVPGGVWSTGSVAVTVGASTGLVHGAVAGSTGTVTYTSGYSCPTSSTWNVWVRPVPPTGVISGADTVCMGGTATYTSSVPGGVWSTSTATIMSVDAVTGVASTLAEGAAYMRYSTTDGTCSATTNMLVQSYLPATGTITAPLSVCEGAAVTVSSTVPGGVWSTSSTTATIDALTGVFTGVSSGGASVVYTMTGGPGCVATSSMGIAVTPFALPDVTITGPEVVCPGLSITLSGAAAGGTWGATNGNASVDATGEVTAYTPGVDSILYTASNGCGTATGVKVLNISVYPDASEIAGASTVCVDGDITLAATASYGTGAWTASSTNATVDATGKVTGVAAGFVTISYSVTNDCGTDVTHKDIEVTNCDATTAVGGVNSRNAVDVFPVPAASTLNISIGGQVTGELSVKLADVAGRTVMARVLNVSKSKVGTLDVSSLKGGVYLLTVTGDNINHVSRVIVNR